MPPLVTVVVSTWKQPQCLAAQLALWQNCSLVHTVHVVAFDGDSLNTSSASSGHASEFPNQVYDFTRMTKQNLYTNTTTGKLVCYCHDVFAKPTEGHRLFFESFNDTFNAAPWGGMSYTGRSKAGTQLWTGVWNHIINDECFDDPRKAFTTNYTNSETFEVTDDGTLLARRLGVGTAIDVR